MSENIFAAIDLGSNSFHMVIAQLENNELKVIDRIKDMVRLADGLDENKKLSEEIIERAIQTLKKFGERLRNIPNKNIRVVGTNTLRKATNAREFLRQATHAIGHEIEIVAGTEEARLIYLGVAHSLDSAQTPRLVMDIGGGSTELIIGKGFESLHRESKYMGCVSFTKKFFPEGKISIAAFSAAETAAKQEIRSSVKMFKSFKWSAAIGASGTIKSTQDILAANGWGSHEITTIGLQSIRSHLIFSETIEKVNLAGLSLERRPVYCGGLAILIAVFESLNIKKMIVSEGAMREGILHDLIGRHENRDIRETTIHALMTRHNVDITQAEYVTKSANALFEQLRISWQLNASRFQCLLHWSAQIHEIGLSIAHSNFHKHGSYLLENSDMPGFSRQGQKVLWAIVRSHRRRIKPHRFTDLSSGFDIAALRLAVILRIAALLNRSREGQAPKIIASSDPTHLKLKFPKTFLENNPLTMADLEAEKKYLKEAKIILIIDES